MNQPTRIEKQVMDKISSGQVKMRPKIYYTLLSLLSIAGVVVFSITAAYSISLLSLWLRVQNAGGPAYGARRNLTLLVDSFPWWAVILSVISFVIIILIVKKLGSLYKIRLGLLVTALVVIALIIGFGLSYSQFPNLFKGRQQISCSSTDCQNGYSHGRSK